MNAWLYASKHSHTHFSGVFPHAFSSLHITVEESQKESHSFDNASYDTLAMNPISQMHVMLMSLSIADAIA